MRCMWRSLAYSVGVVALWLCAPAMAEACSCVSMAPCEALWLTRDGGPTVFEATVVSIERHPVEHGTVNGEPISSAGTTTVHLEDSRHLLGKGADTIVTSGDGASCGYTFKVGQRYVIDVYRGSGTLSTGSCSQTKPIEQAGPLLAYIDSLARPSPGATVTGCCSAVNSWLRVRADGPRHEGVRGVKVTVDGPVSRTTATTQDGAFSFDRLPPGHYRLDVDASQAMVYAPARVSEFELPNPHACHAAHLSLTLNAAIEGTVVDAAGKPVREASMALRRTDALTAPPTPGFSNFVGYATTRSDESGRYVFESVPPGQYVVGLNIDAGPTYGSLYQPAFINAPNGQPEVIDLPLGGSRLLPPVVAVPTTTIDVTGRVLWPDGTPAPSMSRTPCGSRDSPRSRPWCATSAASPCATPAAADPRCASSRPSTSCRS